MSNVELEALSDKFGITFINLEPHAEQAKELRLHARGYLYPRESKFPSPCFLLFSGVHFDLLVKAEESADSLKWTDSAGQTSFFSVFHHSIALIV